MTETALATTTAMSVVTRINEFNQIADVFAKSGLFGDVRSQGQAFVKIMAGEGAEIVGSTPAQFGAYMKSETEKWGRVIKAAGIKPQ